MDEKWNQYYKTALQEPFRIFFPLGLLGASAGTFVWVLVWLVKMNWVHMDQVFLPELYPVSFHVIAMSGLFLIPIISGFVLTAIPRLTAMPPAKPVIVFYFITLFLLVSITVLFGFNRSSILLQGIYFLSLFGFVWSLYRKTKIKLSPYSYMVTDAFCYASAGAIFLLIESWGRAMGIGLIFYGFIPMIIMGIGSKLMIPIVAYDAQEKRERWISTVEKMSLNEVRTFRIAFFVSILLELGFAFLTLDWLLFAGRGFRFVLIGYWFFKYFHILEIRSFSGLLPINLLSSSWFFLIGLAGQLFGGNHASHFVHMYLIGGISLFIISIMSRVSLSHGGQDLSTEKKSKIFPIIGILFFTAAITRATAFLMPQIAISHLSYASIFFILALILWWFQIGKYGWSSPKNDKSN